MPLRGAGVLGVGGTRALRCCNSEPEENILGKGISVLGTIVHSNYGQEGWCTPAAMWTWLIDSSHYPLTLILSGNEVAAVAYSAAGLEQVYILGY
eukprot:1144253-Pelagomonas_calceolata.AAC.9